MQQNQQNYNNMQVPQNQQINQFINNNNNYQQQQDLSMNNNNIMDGNNFMQSNQGNQHYMEFSNGVQQIKYGNNNMGKNDSHQDNLFIQQNQQYNQNLFYNNNLMNNNNIGLAQNNQGSFDKDDQNEKQNIFNTDFNINSNQIYGGLNSMQMSKENGRNQYQYPEQNGQFLIGYQQDSINKDMDIKKDSEIGSFQYIGSNNPPSFIGRGTGTKKNTFLIDMEDGQLNMNMLNDEFSQMSIEKSFKGGSKFGTNQLDYQDLNMSYQKDQDRRQTYIGPHNQNYQRQNNQKNKSLIIQEINGYSDQGQGMNNIPSNYQIGQMGNINNGIIGYNNNNNNNIMRYEQVVHDERSDEDDSNQYIKQQEQNLQLQNQQSNLSLAQNISQKVEANDENPNQYMISNIGSQKNDAYNGELNNQDNKNSKKIKLNQPLNPNISNNNNINIKTEDDSQQQQQQQLQQHNINNNNNKNNDNNPKMSLKQENDNNQDQPLYYDFPAISHRQSDYIMDVNQNLNNNNQQQQRMPFNRGKQQKKKTQSLTNIKVSYPSNSIYYNQYNINNGNNNNINQQIVNQEGFQGDIFDGLGQNVNCKFGQQDDVNSYFSGEHRSVSGSEDQIQQNSNNNDALSNRNHQLNQFKNNGQQQQSQKQQQQLVSMSHKGSFSQQSQCSSNNVNQQSQQQQKQQQQSKFKAEQNMDQINLKQEFDDDSHMQSKNTPLQEQSSKQNSQKPIKQKIKKEIIDTSHAPINLANLLTKHLINVYNNVPKCKDIKLCDSEKNYVENKKTGQEDNLAKVFEIVKNSKMCKFCKDKEYINEIKHSKKKNIQNLGKFWNASVRIQKLSEDFLIHQCPHIFVTKPYVPQNKKALINCLPQFVKGNRFPKEFHKLQ